MRNVARVMFFDPGPKKKWDLYTDESRDFKPPAKDRGIWDLDFNSYENTKSRL
jgi:hypothetical protein